MQLTIITAVKNDVKNIEQTIKSVLLQNFKDFEYIIIDGDSDDGTSEIIKKYLNVSRLSYFRSKDINLYDGLNKGINLSKGKFISFMHSGDFYYNNSVLKEIFSIKNLSNYSLLAGDVIFFKDKKVNRVWKIPLKQKLSFYQVPHTGTFFKRGIYNKIRNFNIMYNISADTDFLIKFFNLQESYLLLNKYTIFMCHGGLSTSLKNILKKIKQDLKIIKKNYNYSFISVYFRKIIFKILSKQFFLQDKIKLNQKLMMQKKIINDENITSF
jgi:glycosyltransferase